MSGDGQADGKHDGRGAEASPACKGGHHEEAEAQEGRIGQRNINRDLLTRIDLHEDEDLEGHKEASRIILGNGWRARGCPRLGRGQAQPTGGRPGRYADGDESSGLREGKEPL